MLGVIATIQVGGQPTELAVDPDGTKVYVVNFAGDTLAVIDTASNTLTSNVAITPQIDDSQHMVMHPNGDRLYVSRGGAVSVVDVTSATVIADIALPAVMAFLAIHPNGSKLYVGNGDLDGTNGALLVIDTATHTVVDTVSVGGAPYVPAVSPDGARLYSAIYPGSNIAVIDTSNNDVVDTVDTGSMPGFVVVVGTKLYVAAITLDEPKTVQAVSVIDAASGAMTATIPIPAQYNKLVPYAAVSPDGSHVFVGAIGSNMTGLLMVIDTATDTVAGTVDVPSPRGIAVSPDGSTIYVTNFWEGTVSVLAKTYKWDPPHLPDMVGHLIGGVANGGGGWLIIGDHCYKIPPRPLALFTIARAAAPFLSKPIVNRKLGQQLRKLR